MIGIYSFGGFAREIHQLVGAHASGSEEVVFIDDSAHTSGVPEGLKVVSLATFVEQGGTTVVNAFGEPSLRKDKAEQIESLGLMVVPVVKHRDAEIGERVTVGNGLVMTKGAQITSDAVVGNYVHMNLLSYIAHDCRVGDFVTLSPRASINGRVILEERVYIGANAVVLPGKPGKPLIVGEGAVVGAGAVVTKDVRPGAVVIGSPAREMAPK